MKKFLKKNWGRILLFILLVTICILSFSRGKYLLGNDNYSPELNPSLTIERSIESPAWRSYRVLGFGSESEQADIFRSMFFWVTEKVLPRESLGQVFALMCLFIGSWFVGELVGAILKKEKLKKYNQVGLLFSGVFYSTTLWTVWTFYQNLAPFTSNFGFLPLLLFTIYLYLNKPSAKNIIFLFIASLIFTSSCVIATLFVTDILLIASFILFVGLTVKRSLKVKMQGILKTCLIFGITQLFWILPFIFYTFSSSGDLVDSYINRSITSSIIDLETEMQTATNTGRLYTRILTEMRNGEYIFPLAQDYQVYDFYKVLGYLPVVGLFLSIIFLIVRKKWKLLFFPIFALVSWFFIKGINPPLGSIFSFLQENVLLFKQIFRWTSSKVGEVYLITLVISAVLGFIMFFDFIQSLLKKNIAKIIGIFSILLIISIQLFYANYLFTNDLFSEQLLSEVPQEYFDLGKYLEEMDPNGRIYYLPPANDNYFREYDWGFYGSQFISYIFPNPVMDMSLSVGSGVGEESMLDIQNIFRSGDKDGFYSLLNKYEAKYILVDRSLDEEGFVFNIDWEIVDFLVEDYKGVWTEGNLELYEILMDTVATSKYLEHINSRGVFDADFFVREEAISPRIDMLSLDLEDFSIEGNKLLGKFKYVGNDSVVRSNIEDIDWKGLPTGIKVDGSKLILYPSSPTLSGYYTNTPRKIFKITGYDYISIDNQVFDIEELTKDIFIETSFESITKVYGIKEEDFEEIDMTNLLSKSNGYNCKEEEVVKDIEVLVQEGSSGFSLSGEGLPCVYQSLPLESNKEYIFKVNTNWEASSNDTFGFCIYSEDQRRCLNSEKYIYAEDLAKEETFLVENSSKTEDSISLIVYTIRGDGVKEAEIFLRDISVEYVPKERELPTIGFSDRWEYSQMELENNSEYTVELPILRGDTSYYFNGKNKFIWEPSLIDSKYDLYEVSSNEGIIQKVINETVTQSTNLFLTNPLEEYIIFWNGENISNIPAEICLSYKGSDECWYSDLFTDDMNVKSIESSSVLSRLDVLYRSTSYKNETENILKNFGIMRIPTLWEDILMVPPVNTYYEEFEMRNISDSPHSTVYKVLSEDIDIDNVLLSIPQKESSGWLALGINGNNIGILGTDRRVTINNWKQAWDISDLEFNTILVIYWPNLLGYLGYGLIVVEGIFLTVKLFKKKKK